MPDRNVYEQCPLCHAKRDVRDQCRACDGEGYVATGLTAGQVERAAEDSMRFQYVRTMRLNLTAPNAFRPDGQWACYATPRRVFRADDPRKAVDAAVAEGLTKGLDKGAMT